MAIKSVVFDVGAVLIDWDPKHLFRKLMDDAALDDFLTRVCPYDWNAEMDRRNDVNWTDHVEDRVKLFPDHADHIRAYDKRWPEMVAGPIQGTVDIKAKLRAAGVPVYAITNYSREKWALSQKLWPFLSEFDGVICSGVEGVMKPDPRIYHLLYDRYDLNPSELIFIDDRADNIEAAAKTGMQGHLFRNPDLLKAELSKHFSVLI